jgi:hypothetical protein
MASIGEGSIEVHFKNSTTPEIYPIPVFNVPAEFDIFFRAVIRYHGPFSGGHETGAMWLYDTATTQFVIRGGEDYNYSR